MSSEPVRNSRMLEVFVQIVRGPQGSLRAVEIAGRGIAAEARCTLAALADKSRPAPAAIESALAYADHLMDLGTIEDDLADLWRRRRTNDLDDTAFESALSAIVTRLEAWPDA